MSTEVVLELARSGLSRGAIDDVATPFHLEHLHRCVPAAHLGGVTRASLSA